MARDGEHNILGMVESLPYRTVKSGELQGVATATQLPNIACRLVRFKARSDNAGSVYLGGAGVSLPDGTNDITTGLELDAGDDTGWIPCRNLNQFYRICDNAGDDLTYLALV
jgi:hypothetical protein